MDAGAEDNGTGSEQAGPGGNGVRVRAGGIEFGGRRVVMMVGPCAVESREQLAHTATAVKAAGFPILRGGAFKPRTSPHGFQGLHDEGLLLLDEARRETGLMVVTEVMSEMDVENVARHADILQIGARTMQAYRLLEAVAAAGKPVLLKRGFHAGIGEWLLSAEYILKAGNPNVILCERGIRSRDGETFVLIRFRVHQERPRPDRGAGREEGVAPPRDRRSQPRDGPPGPGHPDG